MGDLARKQGGELALVVEPRKGRRVDIDDAVREAAEGPMKEIITAPNAPASTSPPPAPEHPPRPLHWEVSQKTQACARNLWEQ